MAHTLEDEEYYCGKCNRCQRPHEGEKCKVCGGPTVSKYANESLEAAQKRWRSVFGR